jgi:hypothetical protein
MKFKYLSMMGLASAVLPLIGCLAENPANEEIVSQQALTMNRLTMNGLVTNRVIATAIAENSLAVGRTDGALQANPVSDPMLATPEGREYFSYIVSCALPQGDVVAASTGHYEGSMGLAPEWEHRAMTTSEKRWVSACLLARVNAYGISVELSLRGDHAALAAGDAELEVFTQPEGAFYGDVFASDATKMEMVACRGAAQAAGESGALVNRDCTEPAGNGLTVCGFKYAGDCLDFSPQTPSAYACSYQLNGYQDCHKRPSAGMWEPGSGHSEVITSFLAELSAI